MFYLDEKNEVYETEVSGDNRRQAGWLLVVDGGMVKM